MIKITDLMADLYEGNSDAQKNGFVGGTTGLTHLVSHQRQNEHSGALLQRGLGWAGLAGSTE